MEENIFLYSNNPLNSPSSENIFESEIKPNSPIYIKPKIKKIPQKQQKISGLNTKSNISETNEKFNYEKLAQIKMSQMNFYSLMQSVNEYKKLLQKNNFNSDDSMTKYIHNYTPYNEDNINFNESFSNISSLRESFINENKSFVEKSKNINRKKNQTHNNLENEKILDFSLHNNNRNNSCFRNIYYSRMHNNDNKNLFLLGKKSIPNYDKKIISIQSFFRSYFTKKDLNQKLNSIIVPKIVFSIIRIQKAFRLYLSKKNNISNSFVELIRKERKNNANKIADIFSLFYFRNYYKKNILIQNILQLRQLKILVLQKNIRKFIVRKKVKEILLKEKLNYVLSYPFINAKKVQLKIFITKNNIKFYNFYKCPLRKIFVLYINKLAIKPGKYLGHLVVNDSVIFDGRYKFIEDKDGKIFNIFEFRKEPQDDLLNDEELNDYEYSEKSENNEIKNNIHKNNLKDNINNNLIYQEILSTGSINSVNSSRKAYKQKIQKKNSGLNPLEQTSNSIIKSEISKIRKKTKSKSKKKNKDNNKIKGKRILGPDRKLSITGYNKSSSSLETEMSINRIVSQNKNMEINHSIINSKINTYNNYNKSINNRITEYNEIKDNKNLNLNENNFTNVIRINKDNI